MNEMMAQLLAQQMGTTEDGGAGPAAALNLAQNGDPMVALMSSLLQQQNREAEPSAAAVYKRKLARARRAIKALSSYARSTEATLQYFAEVFGACAGCWGQDESCPDCNGRGTPGSRQPNQEQLLDWVEPALRALNLRVVREKTARQQ